MFHRVAEQWNERHPDGPKLTPNGVQAILWIVQRDRKTLGMPMLVAHFKAVKASGALKKLISRDKSFKKDGKGKPVAAATMKAGARALREATAEVNKLKRGL
jgi:hypothetical protein